MKKEKNQEALEYYQAPNFEIAEIILEQNILVGSSRTDEIPNYWGEDY